MFGCFFGYGVGWISVGNWGLLVNCDCIGNLLWGIDLGCVCVCNGV